MDRIIPKRNSRPGSWHLDHALPDGSPCTFRATPPNELNDINEINFRPMFVDDEKSRDRINQEYAAALTRLCPCSPVTVDDVERHRQKSPFGYGAELTCDQLSKRYGVTSFSTMRDDVRMWSHYAEDCRGVAIGYDVDRWVMHLQGNSILRQVQYFDEFPVIMGPGVVSQENVHALIASKGAAWEYEREWRLITDLENARRSESGVSVISVPRDSVASVIVTDRTPQDVVDRIVRRLNDPSNGYRIWWIDRLQRGRDATKLASAGKQRTRAQSSYQTA
ncbi:MAG: DUF2971 domain-containing protein [Acidobacteria bacterium]|nr:DUF2971 domain-containing protein [Acidobacteriota bacterium]